MKRYLVRKVGIVKIDYIVNKCFYCMETVIYEKVVLCE